MPHSLPPLLRKPLPLILFGLAALLLAAAGSLFVGMQLEQNNAFCASCHTQPETTYYERSLAQQAPDLAAYHMSAEGGSQRCYDCHAGTDLAGHVGAVLQGSVNAVRYVTGSHTQPGSLDGAFPQATCIHCHTDIYNSLGTVLGSNQPWHAYLQPWQAADPTAATCADCHHPHAAGTDAEKGWRDLAWNNAVCDRCHQQFRDQ